MTIPNDETTPPKTLAEQMAALKNQCDKNMHGTIGGFMNSSRDEMWGRYMAATIKEMVELSAKAHSDAGIAIKIVEAMVRNCRAIPTIDPELSFALQDMADVLTNFLKSI